MNIFPVNRKDETLTWQVINNRIKLGYQLQEIDSDLDRNQILEFNDAIILEPEYQRDYRSSVYDESSLIESAFLEIPIPPIFLASQKYRGVQVLNVVDGQHRLRAFYRYFNDDYALKGLKLLPELNDRKMSELETDQQVLIMSRTITAITFRDFPGKEFELEIFGRYNKGTKPLTPQEIRHAVYDSKTNDMVNIFCSKLAKNPKSDLAIAYAISKDRVLKKSCQENIFVILSIIECGIIQQFMNDKGVNQRATKSPQFAESFMRKKSDGETDFDYKKTETTFEKFNEFIKLLTKKTKHPFSKEIYGFTERGNKFQVSLSMILASIFKKLYDKNFSIDNFKNELTLNKFIAHLENILSNSYLEDPEYNASTTNPAEINKLVEKLDFEQFLF